MPTVMASDRKKTPVTPVIEISGRKTTIGVKVEPSSGTLISRRRFGERISRRGLSPLRSSALSGALGAAGIRWQGNALERENSPENRAQARFSDPP